MVGVTVTQTFTLEGILSTLLGALSLAIAALLVKVCATALHLGRWGRSQAWDSSTKCQLQVLGLGVLAG